jgi:hypothetical protein
MRRLVNFIGALVLLLIAVAAYDTTRPVLTWHEPGPVQIFEGNSRLWVFFQIQRKFRGQGWLAYRGELPTLPFHRVLVFSSRKLRMLGEYTALGGPDLDPVRGAFLLRQGGPCFEGDQGKIRFQEGRWEVVSPAPDARVEPSRTLKAVSQAEEAPGKISLEEDRSLELEVRRGKDSWKLWLRMHPAQREELLVYGLDTEVGELASDLYREQRRSEGLPAPEAGPR